MKSTLFSLRFFGVQCHDVTIMVDNEGPKGLQIQFSQPKC